MRRRYRRGCDLIRRVCGDFECCLSCHEEWDEGYGFPHEHEWPDGTISETCCGGVQAVERGT